MKAIVFGRNRHLMGVLQESKGSSKAVVLWNTGVSNRGGPFRCNVTLSEALIREGYTVLRFDLSKLGDSNDPEENHSFQSRSSLDLKDAVDLVAKETGIKDIILVGLCSGALDAYYFAIEDSRVRAIFMVDALVYPTRRHKWTFLSLRLRSLYRWKRLTKKMIAKIKNQPPETIPFDYFESNYPTAEEASVGFQKMHDRGVEMRLIYTGGFTPYYSYRSQFYDMLPGIKVGESIGIEYWPDVDHLFMLLEDRQRFVDRVIAWTRTLKQASVQLPTSSVQLLAPSPKSVVEESAVVPSLTTKSSKEIPLTEVLASFNRVLAPSRIEANDSFFDFGGTSILAIKLATELSTRFEVDISVVAIYSHMTAAAMAEALANDEFSANEKSASSHQAIPVDSLKAKDEEGYAIIGMAANVPGAKSIKEFWSMILEGREGISHWTKDQLDPSLPKSMIDSPYYVASRGVIDGDHFDAKFFKMSRREAEYLDPQQRKLIETSWQALEDAGLLKQRSQAKIAVYAAVGSNSYLTRNLTEGHIEPHSEEEYLALLLNDKDYVATRIAYALNLKGPAVSVHTACSSSLVAVIEGIKAIASGQADVAIAAASSINAPIASGHLYQEGGIFSRDGHCRPFDEDASGTIFSDGTSAVVIKALSKAKADGDQIYAVIKGWGINNDGADKSSFAAPSSRGQEEAIRQAIAVAAVDPASIGYIECHGTGTPIGDPIELDALKRAYVGSTKESTLLGSTKANIGHLTAAAGGISLIKAALAVKYKIKPKLSNFKRPHPNIRADRLPFGFPLENTPWTGVRRAAISSFGVGGTNAHVIIEEAAEIDRRVETENRLDPWISIRVSAASELDAKRYADSLSFDHLASDISYTYSQKREQLPFAIANTGISPSQKTWMPSAGALAPVKTSLVFCFPGQGSQYLGIGDDLAKAWPRFAKLHTRALDYFEKNLGLNLRQIAKDEKAIHETRNTQALLFAFEWALATAMREAGFAPVAVLGHSLGEITAATIASVFSFEAAAKIVMERGRLMQDTPLGAMLTVRASEENLRRDMPGQWEIAAENTKEGIVISASQEEIDRLQDLCKQSEIPCKKINDTRAFHSRYMEPALAEFRRILANVKFSKPQLAIYSTVTGKLLSDEEAMSIEYWSDQIRNPVLFMKAALSASQIENSSFVEIGPRDTLQKFIQQITKRPSVAVLPQRGLSERDDLGQAFSSLSLEGHDPFVRTEGTMISGALYPFQGERYWLEPKARTKTEVRPRPNSKPSAKITKNTRKPTVNRKENKSMPLTDSRLLLLGQMVGLDHDKIDVKASWPALGMDSLLLTQWALKLQREYSYDVNLKRLQSDLPSMEALMKAFPLVSVVDDDSHDEDGYEPDLEQEDFVLDAGPGDLQAMHRLMRDQIQLMNRQLDLMQRLLGDSVEPRQLAAANIPQRASKKTKVFEFLNDEGPQRIEADPRAFLGLDESGQVALFIEDEHAEGSFKRLS